MELTVVYAISIGVIFGALGLYQSLKMISRPVQKLFIFFILKHLCYPLLLIRRRGTSNMSRLHGVYLTIYVAANVLCSAIGVSSWDLFGQRVGHLAMVNIIPLCMGGRTNLIANLFHLQLREYGLMHRWIGRVCVLEGIAYGVVTLTRSHPSATKYKTIILLSAFSVTAITSLLYLRRYTYELFLKLHLLLAFVVLGSLWLHFGPRRTLPSLCLVVGCSLWLVQTAMWMLMVTYRNMGSGPSSRAQVQYCQRGNAGSPEAVQFNLVLKRPWKVAPGQYVYLTIPRLAKHKMGPLQAHPYTVAWIETDEGTNQQTASFLIQCRRGFSSDVRQCVDGSSVILDGPYGGKQKLDHYDKVLFMASGIGIAAHLMHIRHLLLSHDNQSARVRRITLIWFLDFGGQQDWARIFLDHLLDMDTRQILNIVIYSPEVEKDRGRRGLYICKSALDIGWTVYKEWSSEAGNMALSVCGTPIFENRVRAALKAQKSDIRLVDADFQPDETSASRHASESLTSGTAINVTARLG